MGKPLLNLVIACTVIIAFLVARTIWPFPHEISQEIKNFFTIITAIESLFLGFGIIFITTIFTKYRRALTHWRLLDWATFFSIAWILLSGYPHDNNHIAYSHGDMTGLILIEILFHGTLAIAAIFVAIYFLHKQKS